MKKIVKILGIIAISALIGFYILACSSGDSYEIPEEPKSFIKITGIPSNYKGMIGVLILSPSASSDISVFSTEEKINGTSSKFPLYNWVTEKPWIGSGRFIITILIFKNTSEATAGKYEYAGVTTEASITQTTTTIEWTSFTDRTTSKIDLLPAYFQKKIIR